MRQVMFGSFVLALLVLFQGAGHDQVAAQVKKDKEIKKTTGSAAGVIEIGEGKDGKYRFFVRNGDGKLLAMSGPGGFASVKDAQEAIADLRAVISTAKVTTLKKTSKDKE
jgi:uncharacterized protein YegP (UPF0339 family)